MYWNNGRVIGGMTGAGFYEPEPIDGLGALGLGAIYAGVYNAEVLQAQQMLNDLAESLNYETLVEDGKLGKKTCGAIKWWFYDAPRSLVQRSAAQFDNAVLFFQSAPEIGAACTQQVTQPWTAPVALGPPPPTQEELCAAKLASDGAVVTCQDPACYALNPENCQTLLAQYAAQQQLQQTNAMCAAKLASDGALKTCDIPECYALNPSQCDQVRAAAAAPPPPTYTPEQIQYLCMMKIAQDGTLAACDVPECYALNPSGCNDLRAEAPRCFTLMGQQGVRAACQDPKCYLLNPAGCDATLAEEPTYTFEEPEVLAPSGACEFNYGDSHPQIALLQQQLNLALTTGGYNPIPVTGIYDAATCGAIFELRGTFDPTPSQLCPQGWDVPFSCAQSVTPTKRSAQPPTLTPTQPAPAPTKRKVSTAALIGGGALLAAVIGGAIYATKAKAGGM